MSSEKLIEVYGKRHSLFMGRFLFLLLIVIGITLSFIGRFQCQMKGA
jgi:hypothetical protein